MRSDLITAKHIADQISADITRTGSTSHYHLILVPSIQVTIEKLLEEEGIFGLVTMYNFNWGMIRLDYNVLSLELPILFKSFFIQSDFSLISSVANSLWSLQMVLGKVKNILAYGRFSCKISKILEIMLPNLGEPDKTCEEIGKLIIVDRDVDLASTLLTPSSYAALVDHVFEISCGIVEFDSKITGNDTTLNYRLSSSGEIYDNLKSRHFSDVLSFIATKDKEIQAEQVKIRKMELSELKNYLIKSKTELPKLATAKRALAYHIGACQAIIGELGSRFEILKQMELNMLEGRDRREISNFLQEYIATQSTNKISILRLIALFILTSGDSAYVQDDLNNIKTMFLHLYGYHHLIAFHNLEKLGLNINRPTKTATRVAQVVTLPKRGVFQNNASRLKLFPIVNENYDLKQPKDMGYVFAGSYIPSICNLVHRIIKREINLDELTKIFTGIPSYVKGEWTKECNPRVIMVFFVGGVTQAEVAAFQLLEKLTLVRIIVAGTNIINGHNLIESTL